MSEETKTAGFDESMFLVKMSLDMDADRLADQDESEQDPEEKALFLAFREVVQRVDSQAKRIEELEDVLRSAHCIAERRGVETAWDLFAGRIAGLGIGSVTPRVFKCLGTVGQAGQSLQTGRSESGVNYLFQEQNMNGDDVTHHNKSIPWWPDEMPWWQRVLCVLGYHKWETRQTAKGHCYGFETEEGKRKGRFGLHDETPMKLTDQCSRCGALGSD